MTDVIQANDLLIKVRFITEGTGKALSALLRAEALKRAIAGPPVAGGSR